VIGLRTGLRLGPRVGLAVGVVTDELGDGAAPPDLTFDGGIGIFGQSNARGQANTSLSDSGLNVTTLYANVQHAHQSAPAAADPPVWVNVPAAGTERDLQPWAAPGSPGMGVELSLGRYMAEYSDCVLPLHSSVIAIAGSTISQWLPASTYPTTPPNLYAQMVAYFRERETTTGKTLKLAVWIQGESDATQDANAAAYEGRLGTLMDAFHVDFPDALFVVVGLNQNMVGFNSITQTRFDTIRAAQATCIAARSAWSVFVNPDHVTMSTDNLHYAADGYWSLGNAIGAASIVKLQTAVQRRGSGPAPYIQEVCEPTIWSSSGTLDLAVRGPARQVAGDRHFMVLGTGALEAAPTLVSAAGFTLIPGAQSQSQVSTTIDCYCDVYERTVTAEDLASAGGIRLADPVLDDNNNNIIGFIFSVGGAGAIDAVSHNENNASNTTANITGVTTTGPNRLVLFLQTTFSGSNNAASWANATLPDFAVDRDSINPMNVTVTVGHGTLAAAGSTGNVTGTRAAASTTASVCIAVAPL
jgi:hypothetical protein